MRMFGYMDTRGIAIFEVGDGQLLAISQGPSSHFDLLESLVPLTWLFFFLLSAGDFSM